MTRDRWIPYMPDRIQDMLYYSYQRLPTTFLSDAESGLHSANFNLAENIEDGDTRTGLDAKSKREIQLIMRARGITFDEARAIFTQRTFRKAGIGADGLPNDPKLVTFGGR